MTNLNLRKPIYDPRTLPDDTDWGQWQACMRMAAWRNQNGVCPCNSPIGYDGELHHALITRKDVMGLEKTLRPKILHHTYNTILCHHSCHEKLTREQCWEFLTTIYGVEEITKWYDEQKQYFKTGLPTLCHLTER